MTKIINNYINGKEICKSDKFIDVFNPSTGEKNGKVVNSQEEDWSICIKTSLAAQKKWMEVTPLKRSRIIAKYINLINKNIDELANIVSEEHGKTIDDAKGSITRGIEVLEFASGIPNLLKGQYSENVGTIHIL